MSRQRANLETMNGATAGTYVLPNTRTVTTNFVLEYDNSGYVVVDWDDYRVAARSGYIVKRSTDEDGNDVDWSALTGYLWYWSGTVVTPDAGRFTVTREPLVWYDEQEPTPPIDAEGAINLELAYDAIVDTIIAAGGAFQVDERGFAFGDPPPTYDESSDSYSGTGILGSRQRIVGVNAGEVQFEDLVSDGKRYAGGRKVRIDANGLSIRMADVLVGASSAYKITWENEEGDVGAELNVADSADDSQMGIFLQNTPAVGAYEPSGNRSANVRLSASNWVSGGVTARINFDISVLTTTSSPYARLYADSGGTLDGLIIGGSGQPKGMLHVEGDLALKDGMTAPSAESGVAKIYVDTADGDLKVVFSDGTIKTIVTDT